jgi:putative spermidine/putrescine transport system permease protein
MNPLALSRPEGWLLGALVGAIGVFLIAPSLVVVAISFSSGRLMTFPLPGFGTSWYGEFFASRTWTRGATLSLQVGLLSAALATVLGTLCAYGVVRGQPRGAGLLSALILSPLIVPVVITAIGMFMAFRTLGLGPWWGIVAAHTVLAIPYVYITVWAGLQDIDPVLERAAQSLGAPPATAMLRVTFPLMLPSILAGALFAFAASWDEVVVALFLATPRVKTLPVVMWDEARNTIEPTIAAASSMVTGLSFLILLLFLATRRRAAA